MVNVVRLRIRERFSLGGLLILLALLLGGCQGVVATPSPSPESTVPSDLEAALLFGIRTDVRPTCQPLRGDLPAYPF